MDTLNFIQSHAQANEYGRKMTVVTLIRKDNHNNHNNHCTESVKHCRYFSFSRDFHIVI